MAKSNKKKVIKTEPKTKKVLTSTVSKRNTTSTAQTQSSDDLLFGREHYKWVLIGIALITLGMILMMGGGMPSPDVWDESIIYSPVRTVISPILILAGLGMQFYALFKK